ncbi:hypothetical protein QNI19_28955 [Cytophagaceae bacterium DM2B3-1]|uniref:Energy transducer TonB n=1 Tax=Xanthocytophaga flava TaxID=3048013 RepID=A0ABT7CU23_9BACT|nr:hypothetical protein [Xanthocytophaga flavus]MDJ1497001.1 hypothetical protein [Xanthocytophaga flavus]
MAIEISSQEKENRRIALIITSALYIGLFMICFLWIVMIIPDPLPSEIAEGGVEVSYGFDQQGSGDVESLAPPNTNPPNPDAKSGNPPVDPQPKPEAAPVTPPPSQSSPKASNDDAIVTSDDEDSPLEVKTKPEPKKEETKKKVAEETPVKKPVETPKPATPATPAPKVEEKPKVDQRSLFTKTDKTGAGGVNNGTSNKVAGNNNGDDEGKVGDKGDPRGIMGSKNYSGTPGSGGGDAGGVGSGVNSNIRGWSAKIRQPNPDELASDGFVVFNISIDEDGKIQSVTVKEATLSPADIAVCKKYVNSGTYTPKDGNDGGGVGTIKFVIKSR